MPSVRRARLFAASAAIVLMIFCAASGSQDLVGKVPPVSAFKDYKGEEAKLEGGKPAIIYFWMTTCASCTAMVPLFNRLHDEYSASGFKIVGIGAGESQSSAQKYAAEKSVKYRIVPDPDGAVSDAFDISVTPSIYVIDKSMRVAAFKIGYKGQLDDAYYSGTIRKLL